MMMGGIRTRIDLFSTTAVAFEGFQLYMYRERKTRGEAVSRLAVEKK